jgi:hypothetical protein
MVMTTRREFVKQTGFAAAALCVRRIEALARTPWTFAAPEQNPVRLDSAAVRTLASKITGRLITPWDSNYESARLVFNRAFDQRPALIVRCANASDVKRALEFAQGQNLAVAVRAGGHSRAGFGYAKAA